MRKLLLLAGLLALLLFTTATYAGVEILNFSTVKEGEAVRVTWQTSNEIDHSYFHLWRSVENLPIVNGQIDTARATRVNLANITSPSPCSVGGHAYNILDQGVPENATTIYYYLESFNCSNSESEFLGEGSGGWSIDLGEQVIFLPIVSRPQ